MASKTSNQRIVAPDPNSVTAAASHRSPLSATHSANRRRATATSDRKARRTAYTPITASPRRSVISAPEHRRSSKEKGDHCSTSYGDLRLSKLKKELFPADEVAAPKVKGDQIGTSCEGHQTSSRTLYPAQVISAPQAVVVTVKKLEAFVCSIMLYDRLNLLNMPADSITLTWPVDIPLPPWPDRLSIQFPLSKWIVCFEATQKCPEYAILDENVISVWHAYYNSVGVDQDEKDQLSGNLADHMRGYSVGTTVNQLIEDPERRKEELGEFLKLLGMLYALTLDKEELEFETEFAQFLKSAD